jgi:hypothetical protein
MDATNRALGSKFTRRLAAMTSWAERNGTEGFGGELGGILKRVMAGERVEGDDFTTLYNAMADEKVPGAGDGFFSRMNQAGAGGAVVNAMLQDDTGTSEQVNRYNTTRFAMQGIREDAEKIVSRALGDAWQRRGAAGRHTVYGERDGP